MYVIGSLRFAHYEKEATWGAGMVGAGTLLPLTTLKLAKKRPVERPAWYVGDAMRTLEFTKSIDVTGTLEGPMYSSMAQDIIDLALERETNANGFGLINSWAVKENTRNGSREYKGLMCNKLTLKASTDAPQLVYSLDLIGQSMTRGAVFAVGAMPVATSPLQFIGSTLTWFGDDVSARVTSVEITVENNLKNNFGKNADYSLKDLRGGWQYVSATIALVEDDEDNLERLESGEAGALEVVFLDNSSSPATELSVIIPKFTIETQDEDVAPEEYTTESIPIVGVKDANGDCITMELT